MQSIVLRLRGLSLASSSGLVKSCQRMSVCQGIDMIRIGPGNLSGSTIVPAACMSGFKGLPEEQLWKGMIGVSQQGKKRGRARRLMKPKNLGRGQVLGFGQKKMEFPGLNAKLVDGSGAHEVKRKIEIMKDEKYDKFKEGLQTIRDTLGQRKIKRRMNPLERGWVGSRAPGRKFGAPVSPNKELTFDNFDSILLEFKTVFHMDGGMGRIRRTSILMVTGNGNGTFGYTLSSGKWGKNSSSLQAAVNKAGLRLVNIERYEDRTVFHDFFTQFNKTRIFVEQRPFGFGVSAHRAIQAICQMVGIKDLRVKVEGSTNVQSITKAFVLGLLRQKSHQALADEKQLHLVEMRPEEDFYPRLVASPSDGKVRTQAEIGHNEVLDFQMISFEGNVPLIRNAKFNPWESSPSWDKHLRKGWAYESHERVRRRMIVENGEHQVAIRSHLTDKYPECAQVFTAPKKKQAD